MNNFQKDTNSRISEFESPDSNAAGSEKTGREFACPECGEEIPESARYCPNCRYYMGEHLAGEPSEIPVQLQASLQEKIFRQDTVGALCIKVYNSTGERLKKIEANIECPFIDESVLKPAVKEDLPNGASALFNLNVIPKNPGELLARIFITYWKSDDEPNVLESEYFLYTGKPNESQPSINIDGSVHANGAEVYGMDAARNININIENSSNQGTPGVPENFKEGAWRELPLRWSLESTKLLRDSLRSRPDWPEVSVEEQAVPEPGRGAWMRWELPNRQVKRVYLHFEPLLRVGRDKDQDIICFQMTEQDEVDEKSFCISRHHITLRVNTGSCRIEDHSTHGTDIGSYRLHRESVNISDGQIINLAGIYPFKYREYKDVSRFQNRVQQALNASQSIRQSAFRFSSYKNDMEKLPLNALRLQRIGGAESAEYFILVKELDIGSAENAPLVVPYEDVSELHAKLVLHNGSLRIVDLGSGLGTWINGEKLPPRGSKTLENNDKIQMGSATAAIRYVPKRNGGAG